MLQQRRQRHRGRARAVTMALEELRKYVTKPSGQTKDAEGTKYTLLQAIGLNTMMMFGTGPFISIPLCLAAVEPVGAHALVGYSIAALGCLCDSLIWGELGSRFPKSGGSFVYLRECFGRDTWGKLAAFIYMWQFWISAPAEVASGFIAMSEYLVYIHGDEREWVASLIAEGLLCVSIAILCLGNGQIGKFVYVLWGITIAAIAFVLVVGFANFKPEYFELPPKRESPDEGRSAKSNDDSHVLPHAPMCLFRSPIPHAPMRLFCSPVPYAPTQRSHMAMSMCYMSPLSSLSHASSPSSLQPLATRACQSQPASLLCPSARLAASACTTSPAITTSARWVARWRGRSARSLSHASPRAYAC